MQTVEVDGPQIGYERAGSGPVVMLRGYVGDGATTWRRQLGGLSDEFTVVAWDAAGAGGQPIRPSALAWAGTPAAWPPSSSGSNSSARA